MLRAASARSGADARIAGSAATRSCLTIAPMRIASPSSASASSPATWLRETTTSGRRMPRFIAGTMLMPPASAFAPSACVRSHPSASSRLVGAWNANSCDSIGHTCPFLRVLDRPPDALGIQRQLGQPDLELRERVLDRAAERADRAADSGLADSLRPVRRERRGRLLVAELEEWQPHGRRHRAVHERRRQRLAAFVVADDLPDPAPEPLRDPAVELSVGEQRVDDRAGVVDEAVAEHLDLPR